MTGGSGGAYLEILSQAPERFANVATLFEEGGDPRSCWCTWRVASGLFVASQALSQRARR